jgi:hypothetical protein
MEPKGFVDPRRCRMQLRSLAGSAQLQATRSMRLRAGPAHGTDSATRKELQG